MVTRVYAPNGEPFDIPRRDTADKLILESGWTQTPPTFESVAVTKAKRKTRAKSKVEEPKITEEATADVFEEFVAEEVSAEFPIGSSDEPDE